MGDFKQQIGERIKEKRNALGLTLDDVVARTGISNSALSKIERGAVSVSAENLWSISQALKVSVEWILSGKENPSHKTEDIAHPLFFNEKWKFSYQNIFDDEDRAFIDRYIDYVQDRKKISELRSPPPQYEPLTPHLTKSTSLIQEPKSEYQTSTIIPVVGYSAAGKPIEMIRETEGRLRVQEKYRNCFAVKVKGDSMINAGILNGGCVIVRRQEEVQNGQIALVAVDDHVTIKRFKLENGMAVLASDNDNINTMIYDPQKKNMKILGLIVEVLTPEQTEKMSFFG